MDKEKEILEFYQALEDFFEWIDQQEEQDMIIDTKKKEVTVYSEAEYKEALDFFEEEGAHSNIDGWVINKNYPPDQNQYKENT